MVVQGSRLRLSPTALPSLRPSTRIYKYDRTLVQTGIVHLGLGAFARAHICEFTDDVLDRAFGPWGIVGVNLRSADQRDRLGPQGGLYTALSRGGDGDKTRIIGCITDVLTGATHLRDILALMASPTTRIVSLTVTEKGYCHDPATGGLRADHPDIIHDLAHPDSPRSAIGVLAAALAQRKAAGHAPFTVMCCDNLPHNGKLLAGLVRDFAALRDDSLAHWIAQHGAFPSAMVDRIVPATTADDLAAVERLTGAFDAAPVVHEPFRQWVIEDRFVENARPAWHDVGAEIVNDVAPYENMKLRMLNASHSALAYLGYLGGHETISDCAADPAYRSYVEALWRDEIIPVMPHVPGMDLHSYAAQLMARYANPAIRHRTWQIAMDGSQKLPQRLLGTIRERLTRGLPIQRLALAVAAWMIYVGGTDLKGQPIDVRDPMLADIKAAMAHTGNAPDACVAALLGITAIFGQDLSEHPGFRHHVTDVYRKIRASGARAALAA